MPKQERATILPEQPKAMEKGDTLKMYDQTPESPDDKLNKEANNALTHFVALRKEINEQDEYREKALKNQLKSGPPTAEQKISKGQLAVLTNELKGSAEHLKELSFMVKNPDLVQKINKAYESAEYLINQFESGSIEQAKIAETSTENKLRGRELEKQDLQKQALEQTAEQRLAITKLKLKFKKDFGTTYAQALEESKKPLSRFKRFADSLVLTNESKKKEEQKKATIQKIQELTQELANSKKAILSESTKNGLNLDPLEAETSIDDPLATISPDTIRELIDNQQEFNELINDLRAHISEELNEQRTHPEELPPTAKTPEQVEMEQKEIIQTCLENFGGDEKARQIADSIWKKVNNSVGDVSEQQLDDTKSLNRLDVVKAWSNVYKKYTESQIVKAENGIADVRDNQDDINYSTKYAQELSSILGLTNFEPISEYFTVQEKVKSPEKPPAKPLSKDWMDDALQNVEGGAYQAWQDAADMITGNQEKAEIIIEKEIKELAKLFRNYQKMGKHYSNYFAPRAFQEQVKKIIKDKIGDPPEATILVLLQAMANKAESSTSEADKLTSDAIYEALDRIKVNLTPDTLRESDTTTLPDLPKFDDEIDTEAIDDSLKETQRLSQEPELPRFESDTLKDEPTLRDPEATKKPKTTRKPKTLRKTSSRGRKA